MLNEVGLEPVGTESVECIKLGFRSPYVGLLKEKVLNIINF